MSNPLFGYVCPRRVGTLVVSVVCTYFSHQRNMSKFRARVTLVSLQVGSTVIRDADFWDPMRANTTVQQSRPQTL